MTTGRNTAAADASQATTCYRMAQTAYAQQRLGEAIAWINRALALDPTNAEYYYVRGRLCAANGSDADAEVALRDALQRHPSHRDGWISLGNLMRRTERHQAAEVCHRAALQIDPLNHAAHLGLGNALLGQKRNKEALVAFQSALAAEQRSAAAHYGAGKASEELSEWFTAIQHYLAALQIDPLNPQTAESLGNALFECGAYAEAILPLQVACRNRPEAIECRLELARAYLGTGQLLPAREEYEQLLRQRPGLPRAVAGLGYVLGRMGRYAESKALFQSALASSNDAWIRMSYGETLLRSCEFQQAWDLYEARPSAGHAVLIRECPHPRWQGEALGGKTLLVVCEQGLGDEIMFASVYPELIAEAGHCVLECDDRLAPLFRRSFPGATVAGVHRQHTWLRSGERRWYWQAQDDVEPPQRLDYWVPAGSVPRHRRQGIDRFPKHDGYLCADPARIAYWRSRLDELGDGLCVGVSWRGGTRQNNLTGRSLTLQQMAPILAVPGVSFVCLQYDDCVAEIEQAAADGGIRIHYWREAIDDYDETAALICALDLSISVTTACVHLAGALGRPMWALCPQLAEWRYGREGESMIWYPSVRLFRQARHGEWDPVIEDVRSALGETATRKVQRHAL